MNLRHVLAVVSRLDAKGVGTICEWIERGRDVSVRVVVLVHARCPTRCEDLSALAGIAEGRTDKLKFFVRPLTHWGEALTWVRFDYGRDSPPLLWIAAAGNLGLGRPEPHNGHVLLTPDAGMDQQFVTWYSGVEALAVPLDRRTSAIPPLVPAQGTIDGRLAWEAYVEKCRTTMTAPTPVDRGPEANSTNDSAPNNSPKDTPEKIAEEVRKETGILKPDPLVSIVSQLFQKGFHVALDKGSCIPPLEVPINAQLFGIDRVRQRGVILRRVEYNMSVPDDKRNKELEKHRKAASELLPKFTFGLVSDSS